MQMDVPDTLKDRTFFTVAARAGNPSPVGVVIFKYTLALNGQPATTQETVWQADELYPPPPDAQPRLAIKYEGDLASFKPFADIVIVRDSSLAGAFGNVRIDRGAGFGAATATIYGWRSRTDEPRKSEAGTNLAAFQPDPANKYKLPDNFQNNFFNGSPLTGVALLKAGDVVQFDPPGAGNAQSVTIPPAPVLRILNVENPPAITQNADTVIYHESGARFVVVWRGIFAWDDRLHSATLEVRA
jgi:hypothetical protein